MTTSSVSPRGSTRPRPTASSSRGAAGGDQGEVGWGLYLEDGKVRLNLSTRILDDGVSAETVADATLDAWQHVVATYDGSKTPGGMRVYLDGVSQELTPLLDLVGNRLPARYPLRIGASGSDKPRFQGRIDDLRIYDRVLTPERAAVVATPEPVSAIAALARAERTAAQAEKLRLAFFTQYAPPEILQAWRTAGALERRREELWASFPTVMVMEEMAERRPTFRLKPRGLRQPGRIRLSRRARDTAAAARGSRGEPPVVRALAGRPGTSAHRRG